MKLAIAGCLMIAAVLAASTWAVSSRTRTALAEDSLQELGGTADLVIDMISVYAGSLKDEASRLTNMFAAEFPDKFTVDATKSVRVGQADTPALMAGPTVLNANFDAVDQFTKVSGAVATVFARSGDDFVRVTTSLKNEKGERAIGTLLARTHPGYKSLMSGEPYIGKATLFGKDFMTKYLPIKDEAGKIIGSLFVGLDFSTGLKSLKEQIRKIKVGDSGYVYALDSAEGASLGDLVIHPAKEGQNILASKDSDGHEFIKEMLTKKSGVIRYPWMNAELKETAAHEKIVVYKSFPEWDWVVGVGSYSDEFAKLASAVIRDLIVSSLVAMFAIAALLYFATRALVTRPLREVMRNLQRIGEGDYSSEISTTRRDETGQLMRSLQAMQSDVAQTLGKVKGAVSTIQVTASEIADGNNNLSKRTEDQAASLQETAASMEELTSTVKNNASNAKQASDLAVSASEVATRGGAVVAGVVHTMDEINESSRKIVDIITVIDGIAFQTNILALNAAVEAARAGAQGRGFAVVAAEVRSLAQRSGVAAREIKELISASVEKVGKGMQLVGSAGNTMDEVVDSIVRVTTIMGAISNASAEQSIGIEQVNQAIAQMDQVTQQNAALVEQAAAAAQSLAQQARLMGDAVDVFKLADESAAGVHFNDNIEARATSHSPSVPAGERRNASTSRAGKKVVRLGGRSTAANADTVAERTQASATAKTGTHDEWASF